MKGTKEMKPYPALRSSLEIARRRGSRAGDAHPKTKENASVTGYGYVLHDEAGTFAALADWTYAHHVRGYAHAVRDGGARRVYTDTCTTAE